MRQMVALSLNFPSSLPLTLWIFLYIDNTFQTHVVENLENRMVLTRKLKPSTNNVSPRDNLFNICYFQPFYNVICAFYIHIVMYLVLQVRLAVS